MEGPLHLVKLCVGADSLADLVAWQKSGRASGADGRPRHVTRMWPRRAGELLDGGSLYWVIRGAILARQRLVRLDAVRGSDGIERCALVLDPEIVATAPAPRRPFQGWRYLPPEAAPPDLAPATAAGARGEKPAELPPALLAALSDIGVR